MDGRTTGSAALVTLAGTGIMSLVAIFVAAAAHGQTVTSAEVLSPLATIPIASPDPVLGSDGSVHLVYEMVLVNLSTDVVEVSRVDALDAADGVVLGTLEGQSLARMFRASGGGNETKLTSGESAILFMDVTLPVDTVVPAALEHRFQIETVSSGAAANGDRDPTPAQVQEITFVTEALRVGPPAVVVAPPLRGSRWVIAGGCCSPYSYHRAAALPINGTIRVAERFAIDFVQLNDENRISSGPRDQLSSYAYFGSEIYAVADGTVVAAVDGLPEQIPGKLPADATVQTAPGNHVVVDIGGGRFAFYAHMQPGSVRVTAGDKVSTGQVLGLLGNSGNTDAPHLHFHIMDGPSPLDANGLPYVFTSFTVEGRIVDDQILFDGGAATVESLGLTGENRNELPLNRDLVTFR